MLLRPALVSLFGRWNWWMPNWAARLLRLPAEDHAEPPRERIPVRVGDA
jgi:RND superfamily putative drug exporter